MCEQTLNIKYQAWSDDFKRSAEEHDIFLPFQVLLITGHRCQKGMCLNSVQKPLRQVVLQVSTHKMSQRK